MDIPLVLEQMRPLDDWGPRASSFDTYEDFYASWRGASPCPTKDEMLATWQSLSATNTAKKQTQEASLAAAIQIMKTDVPEAWRTSTNAQQRIAWATKRILVEMKREISEP